MTLLLQSLFLSFYSINESFASDLGAALHLIVPNLRTATDWETSLVRHFHYFHPPHPYRAGISVVLHYILVSWPSIVTLNSRKNNWWFAEPPYYIQSQNTLSQGSINKMTSPSHNNQLNYSRDSWNMLNSSESTDNPSHRDVATLVPPMQDLSMSARGEVDPYNQPKSTDTHHLTSTRANRVAEDH